SKQPESKHTPVRISAYRSAWQGFILSRRELNIKKPDYWIKIKGEQFYRYELAGLAVPESWRDWAQNNLGDSDADASQWQEYQDPSLGNYRAARIVNNQLETVVFIAAGSRLPERNWLAELFVKTALEKTERMALLTGKPPLGGADAGTIVCACFNVGEKTIKAAISEKGLKTHQEVGRCLKAGTNCGSCVPEIKALL
ncbi:MAG: (2Fe-2S)-binding protein, partial [Methylobacter sp.]